MKLVRPCIVIALLSAAIPFAAQAAPADGAFPFALDPLRDGAIVAGGLALYGGSLYLQTLKPAPDAAQVDASSIPCFDRVYPAKPSTALSSVGDYMAIGLAALLPAATVQGRSGGELLELGAMYGETLELAYSVDSLLKSVVVRYRPYVYATTTTADFGNSDIAASFPSSHATLAFSAAVFTGIVFDKLHPDSRWKAAVWIGGLGIATAASSLLVLSGDHFPSDVVAGAAIGAISAALVPLLHERREGIDSESSDGRQAALSVSPAFGGFVATLRLAP